MAFDTFQHMIMESVREGIATVRTTEVAVANDAYACLPYLRCMLCHDLERLVTDRHVVWYGDPYLIKSCPRCTSRDVQLEITTHTDHHLRGRRLCYHGGKDGHTITDVVRELARIYRSEYFPVEQAAEKARQEEEEAKNVAAKKKKEEEHKEWLRVTELHHLERVQKAEADRLEAERVARADVAWVEAERAKAEVERVKAEKKVAEAATKAEARRRKAEALQPYSALPDDELARGSSWIDLKDEDLSREIEDTNASVKIKELVEAVSKGMAVYTGNLLALPDLLGKLDMKFKNFASYEDKEDHHITITEREDGALVFMKFVYRFTKEKEESHCCFMDCSKDKKKIHSYLKVMRPKDGNLEAEELCRRMMSREAIKMMQ